MAQAAAAAAKVRLKLVDVTGGSWPLLASLLILVDDSVVSEVLVAGSAVVGCVGCWVAGVGCVDVVAWCLSTGTDISTARYAAMARLSAAMAAGMAAADRLTAWGQVIGATRVIRYGTMQLLNNSVACMQSAAHIAMLNIPSVHAMCYVLSLVMQ